MSRAETLKRIATKPIDSRIVGKLDTGWGDPIDYISGTAMQVLLIQAFGPYFSLEFSEPKRVVYAKIPSKKNGEYQPPEIVEIKCRISVPMYDEETKSTYTVVREGFGAAKLKERGEESVLKSAATDAMKKAAFSFGLALELAARTTRQKQQSLPNEENWFNEVFLGQWTQENTKLYTKEWDFIRNWLQAYNLKDYNFAAKMAFSDLGATLTTNNIKEVVEILSCKNEGKVA